MIVNFPAQPAPATMRIVPDPRNDLLDKLVYKAVAYHHRASLRAPGSMGQQRSMAACSAFLESAELVAEKDGGAAQLLRLLGSGMHDVRRLVSFLQNFDPHNVA